MAALCFSLAAVVILAVTAAARLLSASPSSVPSPSRLHERAPVAAVIALVAPVVLVRALAAVHLLNGPAVVLATLLLAIATVIAVGRRARAQAAQDARTLARALREISRAGAAIAVLAVGVVGLLLSATSAVLLPIWSWDALGYHLPIVYDAMQTGELRWVPTSVPFVNVYPRATELYFLWCRLQLGDDALVDFCQAPFGIAAVVASASLARRAGASAPRAIAYGVAYLAVPLVVLQLATCYVDVAYAAALLLAVVFVTGPVTERTALFAGVAIALLLSTKPTAPPSAALLCAVMIVRAHRARRARLGVFAASVAVVGAEAYVRNLLRFGNPIWPINVSVGPFTLSGPELAAPLFTQGLPDVYARASYPVRVAASWFLEPVPYLYDMRMGGLGPLFAYVLLPVAVVLVVRRDPRVRGARLAALLVAACVLATPAAHWSRFTLALPAALLALAAAASERFSPRARVGLDSAVAIAALVGFVRTVPGLTGEGPPLSEMLRMPAAARATAVSVDGREPQWAKARNALSPGDAVAYDRVFELPGQLWRPDGATRVVYLDDTRDDVRDAAALLAGLDREHVRVLVAGDDLPTAGAVAREPWRFTSLFRCPLDPCTVYAVAPAATPAAVAPPVSGGARMP